MKKDKNFELRVYEFIGVKLFISFLFAVRDIAWNFLTLKEVPERFLKYYAIDYTDDNETRDTDSLDIDSSTSFIKKQIIDPSIRSIKNHIVIPSVRHLFSLRDKVCHFVVSKIPERSRDNYISEKMKESRAYKIISKVVHTYYYCSVDKVEDLKKANLFLFFRMIWCATHFFLIASGIKQLGVNVFTLFPGMSALYTVYNFYWAMFYRYNYVRCKNIRCNNIREDDYETLKEKYEAKRQELLEELRLFDFEIPEHSYEFVGGSNWEKGRQYNDDDWNSISFYELINTSTLGQL